jgi:hypothetical protein
MQLNNIIIGNQEYAVIVDDNGRITHTECKGRWPMTNCPTGDNWLDRQLQLEVDKRVNSFEE